MDDFVVDGPGKKQKNKTKQKICETFWNPVQSQFPHESGILQ